MNSMWTLKLHVAQTLIDYFPKTLQNKNTDGLAALHTKSARVKVLVDKNLKFWQIGSELPNLPDYSTVKICAKQYFNKAFIYTMNVYFKAKFCILEHNTSIKH